MSKNLNESKTEAIGFGPFAVSGSLNQVLGSLAASVKQCVKQKKNITLTTAFISQITRKSFCFFSS